MAPPGLEVMYASVKNDIRCQEDAILCAFHWCLISNNFKCVGKGEEVSDSWKGTWPIRSKTYGPTSAPLMTGLCFGILSKVLVSVLVCLFFE